MPTPPRFVLALLLGAAAACASPPPPPPVDAPNSDASDTPDAPIPDAPPVDAPACDDGSLACVVERGAVTTRVTPREAHGTLALRVAGDRTYALQAARYGVLRGARQLVAYDADHRVIWQLAEQPEEFFTDFAVHPSGELTLGVEHASLTPRPYELVRLAPDGTVRARTPLPEGATIPATDLGTDLPARPFRMRSYPPDALSEGWLRVAARGEDLVAALVTFAAAPAGQPAGDELVSGVMSLRWTGAEYTEAWARIVDGRHRANPAGWSYDEFRWMGAAVRPYLALADDGHIVVGRAWNTRRRDAARRTFGEATQAECADSEVTPTDNECLPFAWTVFGPDGARAGTRVFVPRGISEFVAFDLVARGDAIALTGAVVRTRPDGTVPHYPEVPGRDPVMVPYDGYVTVLDRATGAVRLERDVDASGRGDYLAALRWTDAGIVAVGAADWDRWNGGMSISRGADPLLVHVDPRDGATRVRRIEFDSPHRHYNLLAVEPRGRALLAAGLADAPMTHSGDRGRYDLMPFGRLELELR